LVGGRCGSRFETLTKTGVVRCELPRRRKRGGAECSMEGVMSGGAGEGRSVSRRQDEGEGEGEGQGEERTGERKKRASDVIK
jgi:hypothetical protein